MVLLCVSPRDPPPSPPRSTCKFYFTFSAAPPLWFPPPLSGNWRSLKCILLRPGAAACSPLRNCGGQMFNYTWQAEQWGGAPQRVGAHTMAGFRNNSRASFCPPPIRASWGVVPGLSRTRLCPGSANVSRLRPPPLTGRKWEHLCRSENPSSLTNFEADL